MNITKNRKSFHKTSRVVFFALFTFCGMMCSFSSANSQKTVGISWNSDEKDTSSIDSDVSEYSNSAGDSISYVFSYRNRSGVLELQSNRQALHGIDQLVKRYRSDIFSGKGHFAIISYIRPCDLYIPQQINAASVQASVTRAYLKSKHNIEHRNVTFSFDTAHYTNYKVRVAYVPTPISDADNQDIYYVFNKDLPTVIRSTLRYKPLPLIGYDTKEIMQKDEIVNEPIDVRDYQYKSDPRLVVVEILKPRYRKRLLPYIGVKSNLLTWAGVIPQVDYQYVTPNLELEYFFCKRWSVNMDGSFTYLDKNNDTKEMWATSTLGLESRFWLNSNGRYRGFYAGVYGSMAQFDIKEDRMSTQGFTGEVKEGGASVGCYLSLSPRWGLELGARYGYRSINYDTYVHSSANGKDFFYYQSSSTKNGLQLTGVRFLVSYRFGKSITYKKDNQ